MSDNDYKDDVLAITDEQIGQNWRLGLLRSLGKIVVNEALPADHAGPWGQVVAGTNRAHLSYQGYGATETRCSITEVYEVKEDSYEEWEHNSFGEGKSHSRTKLDALATCACGRLVKHPVSAIIPVGDLIYSVIHAEDD